MLGFSYVPSVLDVILIAVRTVFFCRGIHMWEVAQKLSRGVGIFFVPGNG
jgi:hypothetical protein